MDLDKLIEKIYDADSMADFETAFGHIIKYNEPLSQPPR